MAQEWQIVRRARRFVDLQFLTLDSGFWPRENPRSSAASSTRERVPKAAIFKISTRKASSPTSRIKLPPLDPRPGLDGAEFMLVFDQGMFSEDTTLLLSDWLRHTPPSVLSKNFRLPPSEIEKLANRILYIFRPTCRHPWHRTRPVLG